jgi:Domain of unknown function (DUF5680)
MATLLPGELTCQSQTQAAEDPVPFQDLALLEGFIVAAKRRTYVGDGTKLLSCRQGSHDLQYADGGFVYLDCYFGGTDFAGQEVVHWRGSAVWAQNCFGRVIEPGLITGERAGQVIQSSLTKMYAEDRFLGGFEATDDDCTYRDTSTGDAAWFQGRERIERDGKTAYELYYHGGLIRD